MNWAVEFTNKAGRMREKLPDKIRAILDRLLREMELKGRIRSGWKNFGKLIGDNYHCHLKKNGRPT